MVAPRQCDQLRGLKNMKTVIVKRPLRTICMIGAMFTPVVSGYGAFAQEQTARQGGLDEIVVTARRREESAQDVPVSVTAIDAAHIQKYDMTNLESISTQNPQLTIGRASNGSGAQITLRGIGSSSSSIGIEQSVAAIVDGVYYGQGRVINEGFLDLAGVEVLKGPQALFFGKNATAGVISLRTANPTAEPEYMARVGYEFKSQNLIGEAMASGPISDTLGYRLAIRGSNMFGGYFENRGIDKTYNTFDLATGITTPHLAPALTGDTPGQEELLGRLTLQYVPNDQMTVTLKANASLNENDNNSWNYVPFACAGAAYSLNANIPCEREFNIYQNAFPADLAGTNPGSRADGALFNKYESYALTGTVEYAFENVNLTWINNFNQNTNEWACDCTIVSSDLAAAPSIEDSKYHAFSSELRAQTDFDGPVNLMFGAYYQSTERVHYQNGSFANLSDSSAAPENEYLAYTKDSETKGETLSAYGQASWKIVPTLEATAGVRYTHETKDSFLTQPYVISALQGLFTQGRRVEAEQTFNNWSPEATLTWNATDNVNVYGAYKTAYKSGGFSNSGLVSSGTLVSDVAFDPERARGFEVGVKSTLMDRQLRLNVGAYSYKYLDLQVDFFNSQSFAFITTNAGEVQTKGIEAEFEYAPHSVAGLNLRGSINYNKSEYADYIAPCFGGQSIAEGCDNTFQGTYGQDLSGKSTAVSPDWTGSFGVSYETPISDNADLGLSVDSRYSGSYLASSFAHPLSLQEIYLTIDGAVSVSFNDDKYEISLIGKNLTNEFVVGGVIDGPNTGAGTGTNNGTHADVLGFVSLPRTIQLQATARF